MHDSGSLGMKNLFLRDRLMQRPKGTTIGNTEFYAEPLSRGQSDY